MSRPWCRSDSGRRAPLLSAGAAVTLLLACSPSAPADPELAAWQARAERVTITRDDWGVPHIQAPTDADAVFGLMYAQAEDDFPRIERNFLFSQGRLAEALGEEYLWDDLRMRLFIDPGEMRALYAESPAWLQDLMDAWADGLNYYLHTHPEEAPAVLTRFEPWMALTFSEGSIGGDIERVDTDALAAFYQDRAPAPRQQDAEPSGSNGIAIAPTNTASGNALLLINPHTSFFFRHEAHVTSDEGLNAYGAITWGQFFVYQGFNETAGWMHTSSSVDNIDEFLETVRERDGELVYVYGDEERPVETREITIRVRKPDGMEERTFTGYRTHHGPIVREQDGRWVAAALMEEPMAALMQSYERTKARNLTEFLQVMESHTNSSNNTVFADAEGNIAYLHSNFVPVRDDSYDYRQPVDGSDPAADWHGIHTIDESPNAINPPNGWVQNTNNWPYSAAGPEHSPRQGDYPRYMDSGSENARGVHAVRLLAPARDVTLESLIDMAYSTQLPAFEPLIPALREAWSTVAADARRAALEEPVDTLTAWDMRWDTASVATALAVFWATDLRERVMDDARSAGVAVLEYMATGSAPEIRVDALAAAVERLEDDFGTWRTPWGEINRFQRLTGDIDHPYSDDGPSTPVGFTSGRWGSLASFGAAPRDGSKRWYGTSGNSFVAVVEFGDRVRARAVTAGGLSNDPDSPHFNDQAERYATGLLREVYFHPEQLEGHTERVYRPGR